MTVYDLRDSLCRLTMRHAAGQTGRAGKSADPALADRLTAHCANCLGDWLLARSPPNRIHWLGRASRPLLVLLHLPLRTVGLMLRTRRPSGHRAGSQSGGEA